MSPSSPGCIENMDCGRRGCKPNYKISMALVIYLKDYSLKLCGRYLAYLAPIVEQQFALVCSGRPVVNSLGPLCN